MCYSNETRETKLVGLALCEVKIDNKIGTTHVITHITIPCTYTPDWQCDAHCWHDEGSFDYDYSEAIVTHPDEYEEIRLYSDEREHLKEGTGKIINLVKVLQANLNEEL